MEGLLAVPRFALHRVVHANEQHVDNVVEQRHVRLRQQPVIFIGRWRYAVGRISHARSLPLRRRLCFRCGRLKLLGHFFELAHGVLQYGVRIGPAADHQYQHSAQGAYENLFLQAPRPALSAGRLCDDEILPGAESIFRIRCVFTPNMLIPTPGSAHLLNRLLRMAFRFDFRCFLQIRRVLAPCE